MYFCDHSAFCDLSASSSRHRAQPPETAQDVSLYCPLLYLSYTGE